MDLKITKNQYFILYCLIGIIVLGAAIYDLWHLREIEDRAIGNCNKHWVREFERVGLTNSVVKSVDDIQDFGLVPYNFSGVEMGGR